MKVFLLLFFVLAFVGAQELINKRYSYVCAENNNKLCVGISPGNQLISQNEAVMLKYRIRNEVNGFDWAKLRWDLNLTGIANIFLSSDSRYCMQRKGTTNKLIVKRGCNTKASFFNTTSFLSNSEMVGTVQHIGTKKCWTVMQCLMIVNNGNRFCDPSVNVPERSGIFQDTAHIRLWPCFFNKKNGNLMDKRAQTFTNKLDCVVGCTANMLDNRECDDACNTPICDNDNGWCNSQSPTPPSRSPTNSPTVSPSPNPSDTPSKNPSTTPTSRISNSPSHNPSHHPSTGPTGSPSQYPSINPTSVPSNIPSTSPTFSPTALPTDERLGSTSSPSGQILRTSFPSLSPTRSPSVPVAAGSNNLLWLLWLLVLLCCCPICFYWRRKKKEEEASRFRFVKKFTNTESITYRTKPDEVIKAEPPPQESFTRISTPPRPESPEIEIEVFEEETDTMELPSKRMELIKIDENEGSSYEKVFNEDGTFVFKLKEGSRLTSTLVSAENKERVVDELTKKLETKKRDTEQAWKEKYGLDKT